MCVSTEESSSAIAPSPPADAVSSDASDLCQAATIDPTLGAVASGEFGDPQHHAAAPALLDRRYVTAALMLTMVLASMEQTVTSTAMPTIIGDLHGLEHYSWVASIYLLCCTVSMPLYGRLADALGRKRVLLTAIVLFAGASVLASFARSMPELIIYRGLQGLGAGGIMPVVLTILGDIFTLKERAKIQGLFSAVWGTSALAGPALGAFMVNTLGWRSIFFVNLPFGVLAMGVLMWKYHDHEKPHSADLDLPGLAALTGSCTALLLLVSGVGTSGEGWPMGVMLGAAAVIAAVWFVRHEGRAANPIMSPAMMLRRDIGPNLVGSMLLGIGFLSLDTFVPLYVQGGRGGGATAAASVVTPVMLTWASSGIVSAILVVRWGFRKTAMLGSVLITVGFIGLCFCAATNSPRWLLTGVLMITGLGFGPASMSYLLSAQNAVAWQQRGVITSSITFFRTIGGALGVGLLGTVLNVVIQPKLAQWQQQGVSVAGLLDPDGAVKLPHAAVLEVRHALVGGLMWVFAAMLMFAVVQIVISLMIRPSETAEPIKTGDALEAMAG